MRTVNTSRNALKSINPVLLVGALLIVAAVVAGPVYSVKSGSLNIGSSQAKLSSPKASRVNLLTASNSVANWPSLNSPLTTASVGTIAIYAADCTTAKTSFVLGETVCAKTDGVTETDRFVNWCVDCGTGIDYGGAGVTDINPNTQPQNFLYTPTVAGGWKATIADPSDSSITPATFTVNEAAPLATYNGACTSTQSTFTLGDTVCARTVGVSPGLNRRLYWIDPAGNLRGSNDITTDPQTNTFILPANETTIIGNDVVDNRGPWKVNIVSSRGAAVYSVIFHVTGETPTADLGVAKTIIGASPDPGAEFSFFVAVTNYGPSAAANVVLSDAQPANATFVSIAPAANCLGSNPVVCTIASLVAGQTAEFEVVYTAGSSGTITNTATVDSDTDDPNSDNNTATYSVTINDTDGGGETCSLNCPGDLSVTATSPSGAVVEFSGGIEAGGDCGTVSFSPASGTQFPVGTTEVTATSAQGGGSCTFNVTVIDRAAPTIQCPLPTLTEEADAGETEANVSVPTPSATGGNLTVTGVRDDNRQISDPYPVGTTVISWTATDNNATETTSDDRSASCSQTVNVTSPPGDAPTISCPSNKTFTINDCTSYTATAVEIGTPTTTGTLATPGPGETNPSGARGDGLPLLDPYPVGNTVITWTATDDIGRVVSCSHTITVNSTGDSTPPTLTAPPNVSATTSSCTATLDDELGVATAEDSCSSVTTTRSGVPTFSCPTPQNPNRQCESFVFPTGTTIITYTATDGSGNTTTRTQTVTVTEDPAVNPTISAPANVTLYTGEGATSCNVTVSNLAATLGTPTANDNCPGVTVTNNAPAGGVFPLGNTTVTYVATDKSGNTASADQVVTVVDNTAPTITAPAEITLYTGPGATSCDVTVNDLDVTIGTATTSDNCGGAITVARGNVPAGNVFPLGETIVSYTATDARSNSSLPVTQKVTVVDNTPPTISCPANVTVYLPLNSTAISTTGTYPAATAGDNCPGSVGIAYSQNSGTVFPVGPTTVTATATDAKGNTASCSFTVTVLYNFTGFFNPVSNPPTLNTVNAGRAVPLKFSLSGNKGLDIFAVGYPVSQQIACDSSAPLSELEGTVTSGGSTLTYSPDTYHYNWKTESSWAATCRILTVKLNDGSEHTALFKFK